MNAVVKTLNKYYSFTNELRTAKADNYQKKTDNIINTLTNEKKQVEAMEEKELIRLDIKQGKKSNGKARMYSFISVVSNSISIILSVLGLTNVTSFNQLFLTAANTAITLLFTFVCLTIWYISFQSGYLQKKYNKNYRKIVSIQTMIIIVSMISNFRFLNNFIKPKTVFEYLYTIIFSMILDLISLNFAALSNAIKYRSYTYPDEIEENKGLIAMYIFVFINPLKVRIKNKYDEQMEEYKKAYKKGEEYEKEHKENIKEHIGVGYNENSTKGSKNGVEESNRSTAKNSNKESNWNNSSTESTCTEKDSKESNQEKNQESDQKLVQELSENVAEISAKCQQKVAEISAECQQENVEISAKCQQENAEISEKFQHENVQKTCRNISAKEEGSKPYKTKENAELFQQKVAEISAKKRTKCQQNVSKKEAEKYVEMSAKKRRPTNQYKNILEKLENVENDTVISAAMFKLNRNDWIKIRNRLKLENRVYTKGSFTYKKGQEQENENNK